MTAAIPKYIIDEAASWLMRTSDGTLAQAELRQLAHWRAQSPEHERAWQAAMELQLLMGGVPASLGKSVLGRTRVDRRALLKSISAILVTLPAGGLAYRHWPNLAADLHTAIGERREVALPDGSLLHLNTATRVDVNFSGEQRVIRLLSGEILVSTASDPAGRPFIVQTEAGRIRALGTRFSVRTLPRSQIRVSVYEHAVAVQPRQLRTETRLEQGQSSEFDSSHLHTLSTPLQPAPAWTRGQIISDDQRLEDFLADLNRHRPGLLRCDPAVADLRISGVFQLKDTDQVLAAVANTLPVRVQYLTRYWVTLTPKAG